MSELKPCPFCGGKASIKGDWGLETLSCDDRTGDCPGSWVSLPCHRPERRAASIAAWNARAAAPAAPAPLSLREQLDARTPWDELEAILTQNEKDAERYRWLAANALAMDAVADPDNFVRVWHGTDPAGCSYGKTLDEAIDAAIEASNGAPTKPAEADPCPGCRPGTVCRTPSCGRLKLRAASKGGAA